LAGSTLRIATCQIATDRKITQVLSSHGKNFEDIFEQLQFEELTLSAEFVLFFPSTIEAAECDQFESEKKLYHYLSEINNTISYLSFPSTLRVVI